MSGNKKKARMTEKEEVTLESIQLIERCVSNIPHLDPKGENDYNCVWDDEEWTNEVNAHLIETFEHTVEEYTRQKRKAYRIVHDIKEFIEKNNMAEAVKEFADEFFPYFNQIDSIKEKELVKTDLENFKKRMSLSPLGGLSEKIEELFLLFDEKKDCGHFSCIVDFRRYGSEKTYWVKVFFEELHRSKDTDGKYCVPTLINYLGYCQKY